MYRNCLFSVNMVCSLSTYWFMVCVCVYVHARAWTCVCLSVSVMQHDSFEYVHKFAKVFGEYTFVGNGRLTTKSYFRIV